MKRVYSLLTMCVLTCTGCQTGTPLFNGKDLTGWIEVGSKGSWSVSDGALKCSGRKDDYAWLSTQRCYGDFELTLEWKVGPEGNTGVFCRAPDRLGRTSMKGFEVQARDDGKDKDLTDVSGAVFSRISAAERYSKPVGEWNAMKIVCRGRHLCVELNGHVTVDAEIDHVPAKPNDPPMSAVPNEGYIGLQNHGSPAEFRNVHIREIRSDAPSRTNSYRATSTDAPAPPRPTVYVVVDGCGCG